GGEGGKGFVDRRLWGELRELVSSFEGRGEVEIWPRLEGETLVLDVFRGVGRFWNDFQGKIFLGRRELDFEQIGPGRYRAFLGEVEPGAYPLVLRDGRGELVARGVCVLPSREFPLRSPNLEVVRGVRRITVLREGFPPLLESRKRGVGREVWIAWAAVFFLLERLLFLWRR
ncbi:MAG: hypothetical protein D6805_09430, partial [Planctomycetota bacterium]